jgi:hypothetical protein
MAALVHWFQLALIGTAACARRLRLLGGERMFGARRPTIIDGATKKPE